MSGMMLSLLVVILIPIYISIMFIPYWTRRTESFGVSIPESVYFDKEIIAMRKQYAIIMGIFSVVLTTAFVAIALFIQTNETTIGILFTALIFIYLFSSFFVYLKYHREMKTRKKSEDWGKDKSQQVFINTGFRSEKLTYSNLWFSISFIITIAMIVFSLQLYHQIPDRIPLQYNFSGDVTNWADKSYRTVLVLPIMQLFLTILFLIINTMIAKAKQQINAENPEQSMHQNIVFRRRWSAYIIITGTALTFLFSLIQLSYIYPISQHVLLTVTLAITALLILGSIILSITTGQGGSRVKIQSEQNGNTIDRDDDKYWKLGQFYFNRNDPALFLEKRFGVGWTMNMASPLTWIIVVVIIGLAVGIPFLLGA